MESEETATETTMAGAAKDADAGAAALEISLSNENDETGNTNIIATMTTTTTTTTMPTTNEKRLGNCEVCAVQPARYTCPKCEVKTCSLACSKTHKRELNCNGLRDHTIFLPLDQMTEKDLMEDCKFLEECTRFAADCKSDRLKKFKQRVPKQLPNRARHLLSAASERGIRLVKSFSDFTRFKENTSGFSKKHNKIFWRIEWLFINANKTREIPNNNDDVEAPFVRYIDTGCDEEKTLGVLLKKYLDNKLEYKDLHDFKNAGLETIKLFLREEGSKQETGHQYIELDMEKSLNANLHNRMIIEYPTIFVSFEKQPFVFDAIIVSDGSDKLGSEKEGLRNKTDGEQKSEQPSKQENVNKLNSMLETQDTYNDDNHDDKATTTTAAVACHSDDYLVFEQEGRVLNIDKSLKRIRSILKPEQKAKDQNVLETHENDKDNHDEKATVACDCDDYLVFEQEGRVININKSLKRMRSIPKPEQKAKFQKCCNRACYFYKSPSYNSDDKHEGDNKAKIINIAEFLREVELAETLFNENDNDDDDDEEETMSKHE